MKVNQAVILAAGEGSRMRPLTYTRPKVMLPLANRPILEKLIVEISQAGISNLIIVVGYHAEEIRDYFGSGEKWNVKITYAVQQKQSGTADAVRAVRDFIHGNFLVVNGDVIVDHENIIALAAENCSALAVFKTKNLSGLGAVETVGRRVVRLHEKSPKPPSDLANAGVYVFTPEIFDAIAKTPLSPRGEYEITDSIQLLIDSGHPVISREIGRWFDLSRPWDLLAANEVEMQNLQPDVRGEIEPYAVVKNNIVLGKNSVVRSGSYIIGPVIIGEGCEIGPNCYIRPYTTIGDRCHIGAGVEIKNTIIMSSSKIPHLSYFGDSIIGRDCNFGAGTKIANLRLDKKEIMVGDVNTGRRKLGAVIGDNVQTGINVSINTGTMIGSGTFIGPAAFASGIIAPGSRLFHP